MVILINRERCMPVEVLPDGYENYHIPGAAINSVNGSFGVAFMQQVFMEEAKLTYLVVQTATTVKFELYITDAVCCLLVTPEGNWQFDSQQFGEMNMVEVHCNIVYTPALQGCCFLEAGNIYRLLVLEFTTPSLHKKLQHYPALHNMAVQLQCKQSFLFFEDSRPAEAVVMEHVFQLLQSSYFPSPRSFHSILVDGLLCAVCQQASQENRQPLRFAIEELEAVHAARLLIDRHLDRHYTIAEIARQVGLNRQKLRIGFRSLFGKGLYEYLLRERLALAKIQLEQSSKPIKEIARLAGYHNTTNFCTAFRKTFGITPDKYRKSLD